VVICPSVSVSIVLLSNWYRCLADSTSGYLDLTASACLLINVEISMDGMLSADEDSLDRDIYHALFLVLVTFMNLFQD
jgi:hypothetical protein